MKKSVVVGLWTVALLASTIRLIDNKYPDAFDFLGLSRKAPTPQTPALAQATPEPQAPSQPQVSVQPQAPALTSESPEIQVLWPGSKVDHLRYGSRRYSDLTVVSVTAESVLFKGDREVVSVPTGSLPEDLRSMAIDYLNGFDRPTLARTGKPTFPPQQTSQTESPAAEPRSAVTQPEGPASLPADPRLIAWKAARDRVEEWLRLERPRRPADIVPLVTGVDLELPLPLSGLEGHWRVSGRGYVATHQSVKGGTFHDFEITVVLDPEGHVVRTDLKLL